MFIDAIYAGYYTVKVLSVVPPLALVAADGSELQGTCIYLSVRKMRCSSAVAARRESAAVANMGVVAGAVLVEEHAVEVDRFAVVGAQLGGSVLEMVLRRNCCGLLAVADTIEGVKFAVCFGCNMLRLDLPLQAFEEAVPWVTVGIAGDFEVDWASSRMALAFDSVSVGSFVGWTLVEVLGSCAAGVDRN